jgi:hypothetical protein
MDNEQDIFLEALCLGIYGGEETRAITKAVIAIYDEQMPTSPHLQDRLIKLYVKMLRDINCGVFDVNSPADVSKYLLKFEHHPLIEEKPDLHDSLRKIFEHRGEVTHRKVAKLIKDVKNWVVLTRISASNRKMYGLSQQFSSSTDEMKQEVIINEILQCARDLNNKCNAGLESVQTGEIVDAIDFSDKQSLTRGLAAFQYKRGEKVWKSGLQGVNRMFGDAKGIAPGEFVGFAALSYHYKSGILMDYARWIAMHNKPGNTGGKIPVIVFFSFENEVTENLAAWYKAAYANAFGKEADMTIPIDQMIDYVVSAYGVNGFKLIAYREMGEVFGFEQYVKRIEQLEESGFKVLASIIDYLGLMNYGKDGTMNDAKRLQMLFNRVGNYGKHKGMTTITGLQLDGAAERLASEGVTNVVKKFSATHIADCKGIKRELDVLVFMHKEVNHLGVPYLTMKLDKHKYIHGTSQSQTYTAYRFTATGIMDDIGGKDMSVENIYDETSVVEAAEVF